tara:strand:- start:182 stop:373 length:192 start_codon:yes stop_codon:yes gene_type:complete
MKKSDLKSYIRENIIEILSEESVEDIEAKTKAYGELAAAKKEAGLEEELSPAIRQKKKRPNAS